MPKLIVLQRMYPSQTQLSEAEQLKNEWFDVLKRFPECQKLELICCVEGQVAWLEQWDSKKGYDECINQKLCLGLTEFPARMMNCSSKAISRDFYHAVPRY